MMAKVIGEVYMGFESSENNVGIVEMRQNEGTCLIVNMGFNQVKESEVRVTYTLKKEVRISI